MFITIIHAITLLDDGFFKQNSITYTRKLILFEQKVKFAEEMKTRTLFYVLMK